VSVVLDAIKFNHDPNSALTDAINLRRNATQVVSVPEWRNGVSTNPEDSPAAYAQNTTRGHTLTIQAQFHRTDAQLTAVKIRAVDADVNPPEPRGCLEILVWLLLLLLRALAGNVLGRVRTRTVYFPSTGQTGFETFELANVRLWSVGVGVHTTTWRWQYRTGRRQPWVNFATTPTASTCCWMCRPRRGSRPHISPTTCSSRGPTFSTMAADGPHRPPSLTTPRRELPARSTTWALESSHMTARVAARPITQIPGSTAPRSWTASAVGSGTAST
jgi:hypothetical protein